LYCRHFECALFKAVVAGACAAASALRVIRAARRRASRVRTLIASLGETDEQASLNTRFQRLTRQLSQARLDKQTAETYGHLTVAMHDLNLLLSQTFYPGDGP